jgi:hypothetical protein
MERVRESSRKQQKAFGDFKLSGERLVFRNSSYWKCFDACMRAIFIILSLLALVVLGGTAFALSSSSGSQRTIYACVNKATGALRVVGRPTVCRGHRRGRPGERRIAWNQTGPRGPVGPPGATGPTGPSDGYSVQDPFAQLGPHTVTLTVPPGDYTATGGCTAQIDGSPAALAFGLADAVLSIGTWPPPSAEDVVVQSQASVPNEGYAGIRGGGQVQYGAATLSNSGAVMLPSGGQISETCENGTAPFAAGAPDVTAVRYADVYLSAIRVASLSSSTTR